MSNDTYLILGGCGFIGRNLVQYLIDNNLAAKIRVADKVIPQLAYLNKTHEAAFCNPIVEFVSCDLSKNLSKAFDQHSSSFDYVVNCAGETRYGLTDPIYREGIVNLTTACAKMAAKNNAKRFIELSSGCMASNSKIPHKENDPIDPWNPIASFKLMAEKSLTTIPNLNFTVLRPAIVYGVGDRSGITPRLVIAAVYRYLDETMKVLWNRNLMTNTIHVIDLCRAICHVARNGNASGEVYNVVDEGCSTQGTINDLISQIFNINTTYVDNIITSVCKFDLNRLTKEINDKHSGPWATICQSSKITSTPLSSYLHKENLLNKHLFLDGSKLANSGFSMTHPKPSTELLIEIIDDYAERNLFPKDFRA